MNGVAVITVGATFYARETGTAIETSVLLDGVFRGGDIWDAGDVDGYTDGSQSLTMSLPVTKGGHVVALGLREVDVSSQFSSVYLPRITVEIFPSGTAGTPPTPDRPGGADGL